MNAVKGTNRLILDDMRWYLMLFSLITLMLTAVYLAVGFIFDVAFTTQLFGPMYGDLCICRGRSHYAVPRCNWTGEHPDSVSEILLPHLCMDGGWYHYHSECDLSHHASAS